MPAKGYRSGRGSDRQQVEGECGQRNTVRKTRKAAGGRLYGCGIKLAAPDVACYNAVLGGLLGASRMAEAGQLLAEMEEEDGVEASPETLALFIASPKGALGVRQTA